VTRFLSTLLLAIGLASLYASSAFAQTVTWTGTGTCYHCPGSWTPQDVPNAADETAQFADTAGQVRVDVTHVVVVGAWVFADSNESYLVVGRPVIFAGAGVTNNSDVTIEIENNLGGTGGVTQNGAGTLILKGANSYRRTRIQRGAISIARDVNLSARLPLIFSNALDTRLSLRHQSRDLECAGAFSQTTAFSP
jgi:autotransporter-associated beta strand protein